MGLHRAMRVRLVTLMVALAFVGSFALPCLCATDQTAGHGHCKESEGGLRIVASSCCCGSEVTGSSELVPARTLPTPTVAPVTSSVLPVPFTTPSMAALTALVAWSSHAPPGLRILRI